MQYASKSCNYVTTMDGVLYLLSNNMIEYGIITRRREEVGRRGDMVGNSH